MIRVAAAALLFLSPAVSAATWQVDRAKSRIGYTATWLGKPVTGIFKTWNAAIDFDPAAPAKSAVTVTVDLGSSMTGDRTVDGALPGDDWFAVRTHPKARFTTTAISKTASGWLAKGNLAMRGKVVPVELPFNLTIAGGTGTITGTARLDRRAWAIGNESDAAGEYVAYPVTVKINLIARRTR